MKNLLAFLVYSIFTFFPAHSMETEEGTVSTLEETGYEFIDLLFAAHEHFALHDLDLENRVVTDIFLRRDFNQQPCYLAHGKTNEFDFLWRFYGDFIPPEADLGEDVVKLVNLVIKSLFCLSKQNISLVGHKVDSITKYQNHLGDQQSNRITYSITGETFQGGNRLFVLKLEHSISLIDGDKLDVQYELF